MIAFLIVIFGTANYWPLITCDTYKNESTRRVWHLWIWTLCLVTVNVIWGPFYQHGLTINPTWISDNIHYNVCDEITYPFPNSNCTTVGVRESIGNFILHFTGDGCDNLPMLALKFICVAKGARGGWLKPTRTFYHLGLYSLSGKTSYHQISWSLEAARLDFAMVVSLWNLTGTSVAAVPRYLPNFRSIGKV